MIDGPHRLTWEALCADPSLENLPYRVELNGLNQIIMSPLPFRHGRCEAAVGMLLSQLLPEGHASIATAILTSDNVKVADAVWASHEFVQRHADACALPMAPEICVEVLSPTNRVAEIEQKRALYFEAGAQEVWICGLKGEMEFYAPGGQLERSALCPDFPVRIEL